jgi:subtilisin family serine protease
MENKNFLFIMIILLAIFPLVSATSLPIPPENPETPNLNKLRFVPDYKELDITEKTLNEKLPGYIIQLESEPLLVKKQELENISIKNQESFMNKIPVVKEVYGFFATMPEDVDKKLESYNNSLSKEREEIKRKISGEVIQARSLVTGNVVSDNFFVRNFKRVEGRITGKAIAEKNELLVDREYSLLFSGFFLPNITEAEAKEIEKIKGVKKVSPNMKVRALLEDSVPLIQEGILAGQLDRNGEDCTVSGEECLTGEGVKIAIIDTGVDYTHPDLGGCFGPGCKVVGGYDFINNNADPMDDHGHGTHCAGIAAGTGNGGLKGVAPDAKILAYKVLASNGGGSSVNIMSAIERAVQEGADVLSLSLGTISGNPDDDLSQTVDNAVLAGAVVIVAAGNSGPGDRTIGSPGTARKAITVGATDKEDMLAFFSSRGPIVWEDSEGNTQSILKPDILAPGVDICSAISSQITPGSHCLDNSHSSMSGTSMATPHVAGAVALLKEKNPTWSSEQIKDSLKETSDNQFYTHIAQGRGKIGLNDLISLENPITYENNYTPNLYFKYPGPNYPIYINEDKTVITGNFPSEYQEINLSYSMDGLHWSSEGITMILEDDLISELDNSYFNGEYILKIEMKENEGNNYEDFTILSFFPNKTFSLSSCRDIQNIQNINFSSEEFEHKYVVFEIMQNINCSETKEWNCENEICKGFEPLNIHADYFIFEGNNYNLSDFYSSLGGLFNTSSAAPGSMIRNFKMIGVNISNNNPLAHSNIGAISGYNFISIKNVHVTGVISSNKVSAIGGIVGYNLPFYSLNSEQDSYISNVSFSGDILVSNRTYAGGIVGSLTLTKIADSYFLGIINSTYDFSNHWHHLIGGIAGENFAGEILNSYSNGKLINGFYSGGIAGFNYRTPFPYEIGGMITNSYSTTDILNTTYRNLHPEAGRYGGVVGDNQGMIIHSYSTGIIQGQGIRGGLCGRQSQYPLLNSYWDINTSGQTTSFGEEGKTTNEMKQQSTFLGWDFLNIWEIDSLINRGYPFLKSLFYSYSSPQGEMCGDVPLSDCIYEESYQQCMNAWQNLGTASMSTAMKCAKIYADSQASQNCSDGTLFGQCSNNKPLYCSDGSLINNCSYCGCPSGLNCATNGSCYSSPQGEMCGDVPLSDCIYEESYQQCMNAWQNLGTANMSTAMKCAKVYADS